LKLLLKAASVLVIGVIAVGLLLFLSAGTMAYPGGWLFMAVLFVPMMLCGVILYCKAPKLLEKRLNAREKQKIQQGVIALSGLMFPCAFVLSALDFRFGWSQVPLWVMLAASAVFLIGYALYGEVMRENVWLSRTVEVQENQTVVDTGLYGIVRHPMYMATMFMFLPMPLILGSLIGLIPMVLYPVVTVIRIRNEEAVLTEGLPGYAAYREKVKYRLIPFVW